MFGKVWPAMSAIGVIIFEVPGYGAFFSGKPDSQASVG